MVQNSSYVDASGRPVLRYSIAGFIDVLGFSQISSSALSLEESQQILDRIATAISTSRAYVRETFRESSIADRWSLRFFSDNLAFGIPVDTGELASQEAAVLAIRCAQHYQLQMALSGLFVRGALTLGTICLTDEIIFGAALIESYRLESKVAIVPRIVLTDPLREMISRENPLGKSKPMDAADDICRDIDGRWFVNYLQAAVEPNGVNWARVEQHKASVLNSLSSTTAHDVLPKYGWSCRYHNVFCHWHRHDSGYSERYRIDRIDEQSTINRLRDLADQGL